MKLYNAIPFLLLIMANPVLAQPAGQAPPSTPTPVIVSEVEITDFADEVEALGTLKANESVEITSSVTELVTNVLFTDNQKVNQGDILLEMETAEEVAELAEQQSFLSEAQRQVDRLSPLVKKGAASASILDQTRREAAAAKARLDAIQSRIDQRIIKAPFDGVLGLRNISVGALAQPGLLITTIDDQSIMKLDFSVPEVFLSTLKPGLVIKATTEAYPEKMFDAEITSIDSRIDPITRSIQARALIDNADGLLKPGLLMQVVLQKNPRKTMMIPEEALIANGLDNFVFIIAPDNAGKTSAERRKVTLGTRDFGSVEILDGLKAGDQVITHGILRVRPGAAVNVIATETDDEPLNELLKQKAE